MRKLPSREATHEDGCAFIIQTRYPRFSKFLTATTDRHWELPFAPLPPKHLDCKIWFKPVNHYGAVIISRTAKWSMTLISNQQSLQASWSFQVSFLSSLTLQSRRELQEKCDWVVSLCPICFPIKLFKNGTL